MTKFKLGNIVSTPGALEMLERLVKSPMSYLVLHQGGVWGDVCPQDAATNEAALDPKDPGRIMSVYKLNDQDVLWVITEWDRSVTTLLLPEEY